MCETDHLLLKPLPNLASESEAVGYPFHYMLPTKNPKTVALVRRFAGSAPDLLYISPRSPLDLP